MEDTNYSSRALKTLKSVLEEDGWFPQEIEGQDAFWARYSPKTGMLKCYFQIWVEMQQFIFYAIPTLEVPKDRLIAIAEYITRANSGLRIGNLELDFSNGQIRYKSSISFFNEELTPGLIRNAIEPALEALDIYFPSISNIINEKQTPVDAVTRIEYKI